MSNDARRDPSELLAVVRELHADLRAAPAMPVALDSSLEADLAFDSLARVELVARLEQRFGVRLPERVAFEAETAADLLSALANAPPTSDRRPAAVPDRAAAARSPAAGGPAAASMHPTPDAADDAEPAEADTLLDVLDWHVARHPARVQIRVIDEDDREQQVTYQALAQRSAQVASGLHRLGLRSRQTVAIMLPTCVEYFDAYVGILRAGGIPVPIYPPARLSQIEEHVRRHARILENAQASVLITVPEAMAVARLLQAAVPSLRHVVSAARLPAQGADADAPPRVAADDIAFIQYTSGSTADPKGVMLTHANLLANVRAIGRAISIRSDDVFVSWLPLYHDMGLIAAWLASMYYGNPLVVMSPLTFLARPHAWLWAIDRHRGTLTAAPNFAYELCIKRIDESACAGLDLSSLRLAANGAEPVSADTLERFVARFARHGLRPEAVTPVYGLAEAAVGLLVPPIGRGPRIDRIDRDTFTRERRAIAAAPADPAPLRFVGCGRPLPGHRIRIADDAGRAQPPRVEGRLQFQGPSATRGYYRDSARSAALFVDGWLDTGDLAYVADGEVYVTGRAKDVVIRGGRNIYPHPIEEAVGEIAGVRKGCVAVFGAPDPERGTERLVVVAETALRQPQQQQRLQREIGDVVARVLGEPADQIVLAPPHAVLKTSSGKLRRAATRQRFEAGTIRAGTGAGAMQWLRLAGAVASRRLAWIAQRTGELAWAAWACAVFAVIGAATWSAVALARRPEFGWRATRAATHALLRLTGIPLQIDGGQHLQRAGSFVLVANHGSYLDPLALIAALPRRLVFVAKVEFTHSLISRAMLAGVGVEFVERFDRRQSVAHAQRLTELAAGGLPLGFYPEGTFRHVAGLLPFRLGAFAAASAPRRARRGRHGSRPAPPGPAPER
ncbi:MAG TPA: AMP-binding protein, partial [Burkholderiaceae bacterium]|nr:AMP-binding protein [Burkholderiaceae bacterium]